MHETSAAFARVMAGEKVSPHVKAAVQRACFESELRNQVWFCQAFKKITLPQKKFQIFAVEFRVLPGRSAFENIIDISLDKNNGGIGLDHTVSGIDRHFWL